METYIIIIIVAILFVSCCCVYCSMSLGFIYEENYKTGIYSRNMVTSGYTGGLDYNDSVTYCQSFGGQVATQAQLQQANSKGYSNCVCGWLINNSQIPESGYVMTSQITGCGNIGYNKCTDNQTQLQGTYCYGTIPNSKTVANSFAL